MRLLQTSCRFLRFQPDAFLCIEGGLNFCTDSVHIIVNAPQERFKNAVCDVVVHLPIGEIVGLSRAFDGLAQKLTQTAGIYRSIKAGEGLEYSNSMSVR